ncbi:MAG: hypothetical protein MUE30_19790 [Spirosomaceae bacterium]|nr:hypothetical protein [Spirosomataceae bacterium]
MTTLVNGMDWFDMLVIKHYTLSSSSVSAAIAVTVSRSYHSRYEIQ